MAARFFFVVGLVFFLLVSPGVSVIWAQSQQTIAPELYSAIQKQLLIDGALGGKDPNALTPEELQDILTKAGAAGSIPQVGSILPSGVGITATTGLTGAATGSVLPGRYRITVSPIDDILIRIPSDVTISGRDKQTIAIGMNQLKGKGKVVTTAPAESSNFIDRILQRIKRFFDALVQRVKPKSASQTSGSATSVGSFGTIGTTGPSGVPVTVQLFQDANANGILDPGEQPVPWANVKVVFMKQVP